MLFSITTFVWESSSAILISHKGLQGIPCRCSIFMILCLRTIKCLPEIYKQYTCLCITLTCLFYYFYHYTYIINCSSICFESILVITNYFFCIFCQLITIIRDSTLYIQLKSVVPISLSHLFPSPFFLNFGHTIPIFKSAAISSFYHITLIKPCVFPYQAGPTFCKISVIIPPILGAFWCLNFNVISVTSKYVGSLISLSH